MIATLSRTSPNSKSSLLVLVRSATPGSDHSERSTPAVVRVMPRRVLTPPRQSNQHWIFASLDAELDPYKKGGEYNSQQENKKSFSSSRKSEISFYLKLPRVSTPPFIPLFLTNGRIFGVGGSVLGDAVSVGCITPHRQYQFL